MNKNEYIDFRSRKGKFVIERDLIIDNYKRVMSILSTVLVVRAENDFMTNSITYWAYSEHFETISEGTVLPEYEAIVTKHESETETSSWSVHWRKKNEL
jgi:hypothetical protein